MNLIFDELHKLYANIDQKEMNGYVDILTTYYGKDVVGIGAGRMGYSLRSHIMRLSHIGFDAYFIGDTTVPRIDNNSLVIINSSSGETPTNILYAQQAKQAKSFILTLTCNPNSSIGLLSDFVVTIPKIESNQLMKSIYEQFTYLYFDSTSIKIAKKLNLDVSYISNNHSILE